MAWSFDQEMQMICSTGDIAYIIDICYQNLLEMFTGDISSDNHSTGIYMLALDRKFQRHYTKIELFTSVFHY